MYLIVSNLCVGLMSVSEWEGVCLLMWLFLCVPQYGWVCVCLSDVGLIAFVFFC